MKLTEILSEECIKIPLVQSDKTEVIRELVAVLGREGLVRGVGGREEAG